MWVPPGDLPVSVAVRGVGTGSPLNSCIPRETPVGGEVYGEERGGSRTVGGPVPRTVSVQPRPGPFSLSFSLLPLLSPSPSPAPESALYSSAAGPTRPTPGPTRSRGEVPGGEG